MNDLDWNGLRAFVAVAEQGTLTAAARELGVSQPTLGRHLDTLEARLGATLFVRGRKGLTATTDGLRLLERARAVKHGVDAFALAASGTGSERRGTVRLTASRVVSHALLSPILERIARAEPDIEIELVASDEVSDLLARDADIALRMVRPTQNDVIATRLGDVPIGAFASPAYVERYGALDGTAQNLLSHRLVGYDRSSLILNGLRAAGVEVDRHAFAVRTDDQIVYAELVRAGLGIGFLSVPVAHGLIPMPLPADVPPLPIWLAAHRELRTNAAIRFVADAVRDGVREVLHSLR